MFHGVSTGSNDYGVGDIITGTEWRRIGSDDTAQILSEDGEWCNVLTVFTGEVIEVVF